MKISKSKLEQIIREELANYLSMDEGRPGYVAGHYMGKVYKRDDDLEVDPEVDPYERALESPLEEDDEIEEVLGADASLEDYIQDFVNSKDKKFDGDSKEQRIKRAKGAFYNKE